MSVTSERLAELKHETALQCVRLADALGSDAAHDAAERGMCSAGAFLRIVEGGKTAIGLARLTDFMFSLRDRIGESDFGPYEHVEDEAMEDGPFSDGIPY